MTTTAVRVSPAQQERRSRIISAAVALASTGGYDAVQMRAVAERADTALATLYRYFPSKIHLLVAALTTEMERTQDRLDRTILRGVTPYDRVITVVNGITKALQRDRQLTEAVTRAFMFADASAAAEVEAVSQLLDSMFAQAMNNGEPTADQLVVARVISDVWLANLMAWAARRVPAADLANRLELTVGLLLDRRRASDRRRGTD